jgi:hypothetical protein
MGKGVFFKACLQVNALVRPSKIERPRSSYACLHLKKDISL